MVFSKAAGTKKSLNYRDALRFFINHSLIRKVLSTGETLDSSLVSLFVLDEDFRIDTTFIVDATVPFGHADELCTSLSEIL